MLNSTDLQHMNFARRLASAETDFDRRATLAQSLPYLDLAHMIDQSEVSAGLLGLARYELDALLRIIVRQSEQIDILNRGIDEARAAVDTIAAELSK